MLELIENGVKDDNLDFTIIPANLVFDEEQTTNNYNSIYSAMLGYGYSNSSGKKYLTKCTPYILSPTMCRLRMDRARTIFTYSLQQMN